MARKIRTLLLGGACISLVVASGAIAQTASSAGEQTTDEGLPQTSGAIDTTTSENDPLNAGDIVVTAQKREQRLQDVPISLEVVTGQRIDDFAANDFKAIQNYVPNVFVQQTNGNDTIYIRGFGSPPQNFSFDQAVSVYVDGIYTGRVFSLEA